MTEHEEDAMAREYMISSSLAGTDLQITDEDDVAEDTVRLKAVSDEGQIREAEKVINERYFGMDPFPGFHWVRMGSDGWRTTDHDRK